MEGEELVDAEVIGVRFGCVGLRIAMANNAVSYFDVFELSPSGGCVQWVSEVG